jgi:hypothetical protein
MHLHFGQDLRRAPAARQGQHRQQGCQRKHV